MNKKFFFMVFLSVTVCFAGEGLAKELMVFPANDQGEEQMEKDKYECYSWAKKESGFDPMEIPKATEPPPQQQARGGGVVRGAAGGAIAGAATGKITGNSGSKGAKYGAAGGAALGGMRQAGQRNADKQAQAQWENEQAQNYMKNRDGYNRAYGACLEGKGYTVK